MGVPITSTTVSTTGGGVRIFCCGCVGCAVGFGADVFVGCGAVVFVTCEVDVYVDCETVVMVACESGVVLALNT